MNFNFKTAIGSIAPMLATMLGGPLAGTAVTALEGALGLTPGTGADGVTAAVAAGMTPEQIAAVRAADQTHAERLKQMDIDVEKMNKDFTSAMVAADNADRDSARKANVSGSVQRQLFWLTLAILVLTMGSEVVVLFKGYPKDVPELVVGRVLGLLDAVATTVLVYWFGSSAGSQAKDATIANQAKAAAQ